MKDFFVVPEIEIINVEFDIIANSNCPTDGSYKPPICSQDCEGIYD